MRRRKSIMGALALCVLSLCALGATNASALGMTAVKCVNVGAGKGNYTNSSCVTPKSVGGEFDTVQLPLNTPTEGEGQGTTASHVTGSTASPVGVFKATVGGIAIEITCGKATGTGKVTNVEVEGRMAIHGTEAVGTSTECHASKQTDTTAICSVQGTSPAAAVGEIKSNAVTGTSIGTEHVGVTEPENAGKVFTEFNILKGAAPCFTTGANLPVKVTGKIQGIANTETHSHGTTTPATNGGEFKANGAAAAVEGTGTSWMKGVPAELIGAETF